MSQAGDEDNSWRLFTSEDMIQGYKSLKRRKTAKTVKKASREKISSHATETATQPGHSKAETMLDKLDMNSTIAEDMDTESPASAITYLQETDHAGTRQSCKSILQEQKRPPRTPFTDITNTLDSCALLTTKVRGKDKAKKTKFNSSNIVDEENAKTSTLQSFEDRIHKVKGKTTNFETNSAKEKGKAKISNWENATLKDWSRNLFAEEFSTDKSTNSVLYDEDLEETRVEASYYSDDSDSDMDFADGEDW
uniref:Uncharacterized protein n=1 Tax=Daucus carota subsp. sativus TaxID=79200 RepID=A0A166AS76_DAUCS